MSIFNETELLDAMFNPFGWDRANYKFARDEKDMHPYSIINTKDRIIIVHNILGIDKKDLKLSKKVENHTTFLTIVGQTTDEITGKEYKINSRFTMNESELDLSKVECNMKNGLLYITIPYKKEEEKIEKEEFLKIN